MPAWPGWTPTELQKFGIASKDASSFGFPLPPSSHPQAKAAARAVLANAHKTTGYDPTLVAKQIRAARHLLGEPDHREAGTPFHGLIAIREVGAVNEDGSVPVVLIREGPGNLGDRHWYSADLLREYGAMFEGAFCHTDHPTPTEDREQPGRSVLTRAGFYSDVTFVTDYQDPERGRCAALRASFYPQIGRDDVVGMMRTCVEYAKRYPSKSYIGLSINASGDGTTATIEGKQWNRVDRITDVVSVDIVTRAGAGGRPIAFQESYRMATTTKIDQLKLTEAVKAEVDAIRSSTTLTEGAAKKAADNVIKSLTEGEGKIELTDDQKKALAEATGKAIAEAAKGVALDPAAISRIVEAAKVEDDETPDPDDEDEDPQATSDDFKGKTKDELTALAVKHKNRADALEKKVKESDKAATALTESEKAAKAKLRENQIDAAIAKAKVPDSFAPRLRTELVRESGVTTEQQMLAYIGEFDAAFIRPNVDGGGGVFRETASGGGAEIKFTFSGVAGDR